MRTFSPLKRKLSIAGKPPLFELTLLLIRYIWPDLGFHFTWGSSSRHITAMSVDNAVVDLRNDPQLMGYLYLRNGLTYVDISFFTDNDLIPFAIEKKHLVRHIGRCIAHYKGCPVTELPTSAFIKPDSGKMSEATPTLLLFVWFALLMQVCPSSKLKYNESRIAFQTRWFGHTFNIHSMEDDIWNDVYSVSRPVYLRHRPMRLKSKLAYDTN